MLTTCIAIIASSVSGLVPLQEKKPDIKLGSTSPWMQTSDADMGSKTCHDPGKAYCTPPEYTYQQAWQAVDQRIAQNPRRLPRKRFVPCADKLGYTETSCVGSDGFRDLLYCMGVQ